MDPVIKVKVHKIFLVSGIAGLFLAIVAGIFLIGIHITMKNYDSAIFQDPDTIPAMDTALLLGTSAKVGNIQNLYFKNRIEAAAQLYHDGKIKRILISGDNSRKDYSEPEDMMQALSAKGIPESAMTLDYAGFRTLDSIVRAKQVFHLERCIIITQRYHATRALYLADKKGLQAIAFAAKDTASAATQKRNHLREKLACVLAWVDVNILNTKPKFPQ